MFSFSTECNPGKAVRIVNVAGKNNESVSSDGLLFPQTVMEELPTNRELSHGSRSRNVGYGQLPQILRSRARCSGFDTLGPEPPFVD